MFHPATNRQATQRRAGPTILAVSAALVAIFLVAAPAAAQGASTLEVMNNPNNPSGCPSGSMGYKLGAGQLSRDGTFRQYWSADSAFSVEVSSPADDGEAMTFSFRSANADVVLVRVKGGNDFNAGYADYWFNPAADAASGLTAPLNGNTPAANDTFGVSHVIFCMQTISVSTDPPTTSESEPPTDGSEPPTDGTNPPTGGELPGSSRPPIAGELPDTASGIEINAGTFTTLLSVILVIGSLGWLGAAQLARSGSEPR